MSYNFRAVTLPGAGNGIAFFFTPEWEKILTLEVILCPTLCELEIVKILKYNFGLFCRSGMRQSHKYSSLSPCVLVLLLCLLRTTVLVRTFTGNFTCYITSLKVGMLLPIKYVTKEDVRLLQHFVIVPSYWMDELGMSHS